MYMVRNRCRRLPWAFVFLIAFLIGPRTLPPAAAEVSDAGSIGQWSPSMNWPCVAINLVLLPTGKVIFWPRDGDIHSWDPLTGAIATVTWPGHNIFCTGHSALADGRLLLAGGAVVDGLGLPYASIYNPFTDSWTQLPNMNAGRWYPTSTTLADGSALIVSGSMSPSFEVNDLPQVWNGDGSWRNLTAARTSLPLYPFMFLAPNGKVFNAGPNTITRYLDTAGTGSWTDVGARSIYRDYGSAVLYDNGKVLLVGGQDPPTNTAEVIDLNAPNPVWRSVAPMAFPRRQCNATLLPDGKVLVNGGVSGSGFNNRDTPVYPAEIWDPATETWSRMASQTQPRWYHSTAILLPDGRVVSAGGDDTLTAEVYSPPYLFKGARPTISSAPGSANYGETFFVGTPQANGVTKVNFVRVGSATHAFNMDQRICRLNFAHGGGGLNVTAPSDSKLAPPGYYMLFLLDAGGVPSVAQMVRLGGSPVTAPKSPTNLNATTSSSTQVMLTWVDGGSDKDGFGIERSTDGVNFTPVAAVGANVTTYLANNLAPSTMYRFRVYAYKATSNSGYSPIATATTASSASSSATPPLPPSNLVAANVSTRQIDLSWTDNSANEEGFAIESSVDGAPFTQIATVGPGVTSFLNTGLTAATIYYYRIRAFRGTAYSAYSTVVNSTTFADGRTAPLPPWGLTATAAGTTQINLEWVDGSSDEEGFQIERSLDGWAFTPIGTVSANITTYASTNLAPATTYYFRVRAHRGINTSYFTGTANATTASLTAPPPPSPPTAPTTLRATTISTQQIYLTWGDNSSDEDGFAVERSIDGINFGLIATVGANVTSYNNTNLNASTAYWYRARAFKAGSYSGYSNTANATTSDLPVTPPPTAPANLKATAVATSQIDLVWSDNSGDEDGFAIERSLDGTNFGPIATVGANVTSYSSGGLSAATTYWYRVRAYRGTSNSGYSNTAAATTNAPPPTPPPATPGNLVATAISSSQINLGWSDNSGDEDGFAIERSTDGINFGQIATVAANVTGYSSGDLNASTTYWYRVRAYRGTSFSAFTPAAGATTIPRPPTAPTSLVATAASSSQIHLTWTDNSANESGFTIERSLDGTTFAMLVSVAANVTSYTHSGLTAGTTYYYRVYATGSGGNSDYSNRAQATTPVVIATLPAAPSNPMVVPLSTSMINLTWLDNSANETGFVIERSSGGSAFLPIGTVGANVTVFIDGIVTPLTAGTTYSYRIRAQNAYGVSAPSSTVNVATATVSGRYRPR
jgi:Galactose oxidase-like, Early set domain/Fibronectin type III domain